MKTLYFDCSMGAAGDMLMSALYELIEDKDAFIDSMNRLGIPGIRLAANSSVKSGIAGTHIAVTVGGVEEESVDIGFHYAHAHAHGHGHGHGCNHEHGHEYDHEQDHHHGREPDHAKGHAHNHGHEHVHGLVDIERLINSLSVSERVRDSAIAVYRLIAGAESTVHGKPIDNIHFHEVGTMDAVADIVGVCVLMEALSPDLILASPVHVGSGHVRCAHGILPVPAPATAHILRGVPVYGGAIHGELCTPTGAAILKHFVSDYGGMPNLIVDKIGYGMGTKEFEAVSCVRAFFGETKEKQ